MLYNNNNIYYDRKDLRLLWNKPLPDADKDIDTQKKKTQAASDELKEASNSYEMMLFNGMLKDEAAVLERRVDKLTTENQREKAKFKNFYAKRKSLEEERWSVPTDIFRLVYLKCNDLLPVVEKNKGQSERTDLYLSMSLFLPSMIIAMDGSLKIWRPLIFPCT